MRQTLIDSSRPGLMPLRRRAIAGRAISGFLLVWILASVFVHPLPREVSGKASAPLLPGTDVPPAVADVFGHACVNCHSEKTQWPWYSRVAPVSWLVEGDVAKARSRMNLSRWDEYAGERQEEI